MDNKNKKEYYRSGLVFIIFSVLLALVSAVVGIVTIKKDKEFTPTTATVVSYKIGNDCLFVTAEYVVDDQTYIFKYTASDSFVSPNPLKVGDIIDIKYNPNRPEKAILAGYGVKNIMPMMVICGVMIIFGAIVMIKYRQYK